MNVLILIDWFAPAYKAGGPIQSIVNLVEYKINGIEYRIICSTKDLGGEALPGIQENEWVSFNATTQVWYNSGSLPVNPSTILQGWKPDVLFINGIYSFQYNFIPLVFWKVPRKIISARGMLHEGALQQKPAKKKIYLSLWKILRLHRRHFFHATNLDEAKAIKVFFGETTKFFVAINFPRIFQPAPVLEKKEGSLKIISIGIISPMKNYDEVLKSLAQVKATVQYEIYGPVKEEAYWQQCKQLIETLPPNIQVVYKGNVPSAGVEAALAKAHVFILPSKSENFGHALYEALTAGKPIITSHHTPWNHLQESHAGINCSVGNDEVANAICFFAAMKEEALKNWSLGARQYALSVIDGKEIANQYANMFMGHV